MINITFSTCWYNLKAKFPDVIYFQWIDNMLTNVNNYYLVVYTDKQSLQHLKQYENANIKIIVKEYTEFYNYKYKEQWINNHENNTLLKNKIDWKVNMLWAEKISFVQDTINNEYFKTEYYGWCDIGYFRNRYNDLSTLQLKSWPDTNKINNLNKDRIHYAIINNDQIYTNNLFMLINNKNEKGLPLNPIPEYQNSIAGGFFIGYKKKINWWKQTFDNRLQMYFVNDYLVKDDQIIVIDCVFTDLKEFQLYKENNMTYDNWFMFQRLLL